MEDERVGFLGDSIISICQLANKQKVYDALKNSKFVRNFLDDGRILSLKAIVFKDGSIELTTDFKAAISYEDAVMEVTFVKRSSESINPENISKIVDVHTLLGSPLESLYNSLKAVWCPTLLENPDWKDKLPGKIGQLLTELEATLGSQLPSLGENSKESGSDINKFFGVMTLNDEANFWKNLKEDRRSPYKGIARSIEQAINEIAPSYQDILSLEYTEVAELIQKTSDTLNTIWNAAGTDSNKYPQARMQHIFGCISGTLSKYVQGKLSTLNIWKDGSGQVRMHLQDGIRLLEKWIDVPRNLISKFWTGSDHRWSGDPYEDNYLKSFLTRLEHVRKIRTSADELAELLTAEERRSFHLERLFEPLEDTRPIAYNPYTEPLWQKAVLEYERSIAPIEAAVAAHFRRKISPIMDRPLLLLREFERYRNLLQRPNIRKSLVDEREALLSLLKDLCKKIEVQVDNMEGGAGVDNDGDGTGGGGGRLLSTNVSGIVLLRQLGARVASMLSTSQGLLDDIEAYPRFVTQCENLVSRIKNEQDGRFETWVVDMEKLIEDDDSLKLQGSLLTWQEGLLVVNFSENLVRFLREVRQLDELGFEIPRSPNGRNKSIADKALEAEKYYRYGILLKKTANFYNSLQEQVIDVQEQLLLESLTAFNNIVTKPSAGKGKDVSWGNPTDVENYIRSLQECAEKLSSENRYLRKVHEDLRTLTVSLMSLDLLKQTEQWKDKWRFLKAKMQPVREKYNEKDCRQWVLHWDHQVYKSMEASYQLGLESLHESLPEIKAEMVFVNKRLEYKPPLEQIRQNFYKEMKKFVAMPASFEGFGNAALYRRMGPRNSKRLITVFSKAEMLFERLASLLRKYSSWVRLGQVDLDQMVETHVITVEEFVANFRMLKSKRKEIDKIPDSEKIGCCTVSLSVFKSFLESLLFKVNDALLIRLRMTILQDFKEVDVFLETSLEKLTNLPDTVDEIIEANTVWTEIDMKKNGMKLASKNCVERKKLLIEYAPGTSVDTSKVTQAMSNLDGEGGRWDEFDVALEAYNELVEKKKGELKTVLENDVITLNQDISKFRSRWNQLKPTEVKNWEFAAVQRIFDSLQDWNKEFSDMSEKSKKLTDFYASFGMPTPRFDGLEAVGDDMKLTNESWDMLKQYMEEREGIAQQDWLRFSIDIYKLQDFALKWLEKCKTVFKGTFDSVGDHISDACEKIKKSIPALKYCRGEPFKEDHWTELLQGKLGLPRNINKENVRVEHFLSCLKILMEPSTVNFVKNLQARALGEVQIREALQELRTWQRTAELKLLTTEESGRRLPLIKDWKDMFLEMGDKQSLLASLKESQFYKAFSDEGSAIEAKLAILDAALHTLNAIQRKWVYLEPIFGRGALPSEEARFRRIDEDFSEIIIAISREPLLFNLADEAAFPHINDRLKSDLDQLERCQKALTDFLEAKRSAMPRFYFIGDDDLLEILGQAKNPAIIQAHLKKLFQGINKVEFDEKHTKITSMISSANEVVQLENPVPITDKVEDWLEKLNVEMRNTLASLLVQCLGSKNMNWSFPSQILCLAQQIRFTADAEDAIKDGALEELAANLTDNLRQLTGSLAGSDWLTQLKIKSMVLDVMHNIDVCSQLIKHNTTKLNEWQWKKQLRYYMEKDLAVVKMSDAKFAYTYEYQGNAPKLVHTPLTDKCYLTLTQGMHMGFGGNPYGPAGTGKTESVKALASCLGRQVLVFNCDEGIDFQSMGRIFIGLVKCGAWGCFDEFNRLKEDQLSAISQQIQVIQDAIKARSSPISLLGRSVEVDFNAGIFVTLNPAGKGYGGRSRLPDNLKALFRPVAMGAPDNELIAEVNLVTEGFVHAKDMASKIVSLFKLSRQLLSPQQHYDWGLRALKAVLNSGGRIIQNLKAEGTTITPEMEYEILIKAVRVNTLSKLTFSDTAKFLALIGDVFPGAQSADITGGKLEAAIREVSKEKPYFLVEDEVQVRKMLQLKESLDQRMGCVIVGPSGSGKSTLWRVLKAALAKCGQRVVTHVMNPKSMPRERLLGRMDLDTREWFDGVLTDAARQVVREPPDVSCWIICDGDVDPEWIESLNSVLDDNHLLTLPNGERISFGSNVNFLFETHDLKFASPATVSRMGMIFLSDDDLDVKRIIQRWITTLPPERQASVSGWMDELFYRALDYVLNQEKVVDTTLVGTVMNGLSQVRDATSKQEFVTGLIRGLGGNLYIPQRVGLAKEIFQLAGERSPDISNPLDCTARGSSFQAFVAPRASDVGILDVRDLGYRAVVPTISVQRTMETMSSWITNMEPFILVGPEGCGKSMIIQHAFRQKRSVGIATLHCNAQTTADDVIRKISQSCSLFSSPEGRVYRPRDCERLVLYLKDINLPRPDQYDTCQLIAFLQQLITFDGFYDEALEFLRLERIQIVASINAATTVGRHQLSTRFTAVVRIGVVDYPETSELVTVYDTFLASVLSSMQLEDKKWLQPSERNKLALTFIDIYQKVREKFTVDDYRHYLFTPRDVTTWVKNLCRYDLGTEKLIDVVAHEAARIFRDRLVGSESCTKFDQVLSGILRSQYKSVLSSQDFFSSITTARGGGATTQSEGKEGGEGGGSKLEMGGMLYRMDEGDFRKLVEQGLMYYEREERELNMLLFPEALEQISRVDRVLSSFGGHLLLVGRAGVGRRNAAVLAAYMLGYEVFSPLVSRDYGTKQFAVDVKTVCQTAGIKGEHVVLLLEDFQIKTDSLLEVINSLLSSGEVPGLYTHEELEPLLAPLREMMMEDGTYRTPYEFFVSRVKKYLHIVLLMDPGHPRFLYRCESNPALYSQCAVLWMGEWKKSTLQVIPKMMDGIKDLVGGGPDDDDDEGKGGGNEEKKGAREGKRKGREDPKESAPEDLVDMILAIHESCAAPGTLDAAPRDYYAFLKSWYSLNSSKKVELQRELGHLQAGLSKLDSASEVVNDLRTNASKQKKDLKVAQEAADRAMEEISKALSSASERKLEVQQVEQTVAENERQTQERKAEIESELAEIQPILDSAKQAVGGIRSEHLAEIRSLTAPPEAIADVLAAVLMLLGNQDLSWLSMKKFLAGRGVKEEILNFDAQKINVEVRKNVSKLIKKKAQSFEAATIQRVSQAAAPLASWVKANIRYSLVIEKIEPLNQELQEEIAKLEESQNRLKRCHEELDEIDHRVQSLKQEFSKRTAEAERLQRNLDIAGSTLDKAENLIGQLGGEQARWKTQAQQMRGDLAKLPVRMLLAAGFATYLAKTPEDVRAAMMEKWQDITRLQNFQFKRVLSTESELLQWKMMGLPADDLSQENGLVISNAQDRVPFIIDPASVAVEWLKAILSKEKGRPLEVVTHHDPRFNNQVELAVRFGKTLIIMEVDGVEPMLVPLCRQDLVLQGARKVVSVGDKVVDYNEGFRLYLVTRNPDPELPPDVAAIVSQVNFTVTRSGLEGQLLGTAIQHEQPELEKAKGEMLRREEDFKVQLAGLEKELLEALATAEGNLLENSSLIESLTKTKVKSAEIEDALNQSAEASIKLDQQREVYRGFAKDGSQLFFLVKALQSISHVYQFSLASFLMLFQQSLSEKIDARNTEERLVKLSADLEVRVLYYVGRALFKADRPMFALHLVKGMHPDQFQPKEWEIFTGSLVASVSDGVPKGFPSWIASERQGAYRLLTEHAPNVIRILELDNTSKWKGFADSLEAEKDFPSLKGISPFEKVLAIQAFRPDRLQSAILKFCCELLHIDSVSPPPLYLPDVYTESNSHTPILLLSSPGADASKELQEYASKQVGVNNYEELAMGGGQQEVALTMLRRAAKKGNWLCLKNLHLVVAWLPTLEKELSSLDADKDFRLWLTSEAHNEFPSILLQSSLKATYESPPGIKKNLQRTFDAWDPAMFESNNRTKNRLLFLLSVFHAVVQERRTYIPQGWTKFYEFSYGDLKAGIFVMEAVSANVKDASAVDWEAVYGLMEDAIYGGRVDDPYDLRVLKTYLSTFFSTRIASEKGVNFEVIPGTPLKMPVEPDYDSFQRAINNLPDLDAPFIFGLPDNIERSLQRVTSAAVIKQLRALSTLDLEAAKYDREKWRTQLGPVLDLWQQLLSAAPNVVGDGANRRGSVDKRAGDQPVDAFVKMEFEQAGELCATVDASLTSLKKVLFGTGLLSPAIQTVALALLADGVPHDWNQRWEGPEKPQTWLRELVRRRIALGKWRTSSNEGKLLTQQLELGDLFNPSTFLNALKQQSARALKIALDKVKTVCSWEKDASRIRSVCPIPCTIKGLLLQGASLSSAGLRESAPDATEMSIAPLVHLGFTSKDQPDLYTDEEAIMIPVYTTPSRESFLTELQVPIGEDKGKWILAGVGFFLSEGE